MIKLDTFLSCACRKKGRQALNADTVVHCDIDVMYMTSLLGNLVFSPFIHMLLSSFFQGKLMVYSALFITFEFIVNYLF